MDKEKLMIWTKITEDKATWPKYGVLCWYRAADWDIPNIGRFFNTGEEQFFRLSKLEFEYPISEVTHWAPATPPQFDVNDNEPVIVDKCVTEHKTLDFKTNCARCQYGKEYCYCPLKLR